MTDQLQRCYDQNPKRICAVLALFLTKLHPINKQTKEPASKRATNRAGERLKELARKRKNEQVSKPASMLLD